MAKRKAGVTISRPATKRKAAEDGTARIKQMVEAETEQEVIEAEEKAVTRSNKALERQKKAQEDALVDEFGPAPKGFEMWSSTTKLASGGSLSELSKFKPGTMKYSQVVEIQHSEVFSLKPLVIAEGALKGRRVLLLEPDERVPSTTFRFMDLPPEIRSMIYAYHFEDAGEVNLSTVKPSGKPRRACRWTFHRRSGRRGLVWDAKNKTWDGPGMTPSTAAILSVSKQIQHETVPLVYSDNTFHFRNLNDMKVFLDQVGNMRKHIRHIHIAERGYSVHSNSAFRPLKDATDLRSITLDHHNVCGKTVDRHWRRAATPETLVADCKRAFKVLNEVRQESGSSLDILDIIRFDGSKCYLCKAGLGGQCRAGSFYSSSCDIKCSDLDKHYQELTTKVRDLLAKELESEE